MPGTILESEEKNQNQNNAPIFMEFAFYLICLRVTKIF